MDTQILLGDPGTCLTTAVSNTCYGVNHSRLFVLVLAQPRWPWWCGNRKSKNLDGFFMYRAIHTLLHFIRSDTLLQYAARDREGRCFAGLYTTNVAMRLEHAASTRRVVQAAPASLTVVCEARHLGTRADGGGTVSNGPLGGT